MYKALGAGQGGGQKGKGHGGLSRFNEARVVHLIEAALPVKRLF
jgi:hypothetical protein